MNKKEIPAMPNPVTPVKLFCGLIFNKKTSLQIQEAEEVMRKSFGEIDYMSGVIDFNFTDYYTPEMGSPLKRKFIGFKNLIDPSLLAGIKNITCEIESKFSKIGKNAKSAKRNINIDPGYISSAKVVLASTKNFYHRIYISHGIYAEVTLYWRDGEFKTFEWTYPDYKTTRYQNILKEIRKIYTEQL